MNYPFWDVPLLGGGLVIAFIAIPHVFVSHFAIGGGIFLAWTERIGIRKGKPEYIAFAKRNTLFFVLMTLVFGAVTGVGIWFSIGLVHPGATSALIHNFVFGWAIEWVLFLVEIAAALLFYYGWDRVDQKTHQFIGWAYAGAAWGSLVVINGILAFMLTPGRWVETGGFWTGFFNPSYFPSVLIRTCVCLALAGLYALLMASREPPGETHDEFVRYASTWLLPAFIGLPIFAAWFVFTLPSLAQDMFMGRAVVLTIFAALSMGISAIIFAFAYLIAYRNPQSVSTPVALLFLVLGLAVTGVTEFGREAARKPYIIYDYMYSNAVLKRDVGRLQQEGVLRNAKWTLVSKATPQNALIAGREVFTLACAHCHTVDGYNGVRLLVKGWPEPFIEHQLTYLDHLKGFMPPFVGNPDERRALARWLASLNPNPLPARTAAAATDSLSSDPLTRGEAAYSSHCANCHTIDGRNAIRQHVKGWTQSVAYERLGRLESLRGYMPPYEGPETERQALAAWLASIGNDAPTVGGAR